MQQIRRQVAQWLQHKASLRKTRVGERQLRTLHDVVAIQQQVKIHGARPPVPVPPALENTILDMLKAVQQFKGGLPGGKPQDGVAEKRLVSDANG